MNDNLIEIDEVVTLKNNVVDSRVFNINFYRKRVALSYDCSSTTIHLNEQEFRNLEKEIIKRKNDEKGK